MAHQQGAVPVGPPQGPSAPGAGAGAAAPPVMAPPRTYRELFLDESNSPSPDRLANYLQGYRFDGAGDVPVPGTLRDQTVTLSDRQPMAFLSLATGPSGALEVTIVHRLMRYLDVPGEEESGFHNRVIGLLGDIMPHQYPVVEVPNTAYHLTGTPVRVPTTAGLVALLPAWDDPGTALGPYAEDVPETEVVRPRHVQLVPGYYASLLIHRRGLSPKVAFQELHGAMQARGETEVCRDILTWLRAACTQRGGGGANHALPAVHHTLTPLHLPDMVYRYMISKVRGDLPALAGPEPGTTEVTGALAGALRALAGARGTADGTEGAPREPKSVQEVYRETYGTLLRFCNVASATDVAPVWGRLANCAKSERNTIIVQECQRVCSARGVSAELYTPIVTAALRQMALGFQFVGHGFDDLSTGLQPFLVSYAGHTHHLQALEAASVSDQLSQGDHTATLADYRSLREREKVKFPRDITEVCITVGRYAVLCQALLQGTGPPNPVVDLLWNLYVSIQNATSFISDRYLQAAATNPTVANVYYPCIVRAVQVSMHEYLHSVGTNIAAGHAGVDLRDFRTLVAELKRGTFQFSSHWVPLPEEYLMPPASTIRFNVSNTSMPSAASTSGSVSTQASTRAGVSSLIAETNRIPVARLDNPAPDSEFSSITVRPVGTRPVLREHRPPSNGAGQEFCVAWWLRSGCFPNCGRRATHRQRGLRHFGPNGKWMKYRRQRQPWVSGPRELRRMCNAMAGQLRCGECVANLTFLQGGGVERIPHEASRLLNHLRRRGAAVPMATPPWGTARCDEAVRRGSYQSAHLDRQFVFEEMMDFCRQGYWIVLPYSMVRHWPGLRVSPLGAVPQCDRRPRLIVDYSFPR